MPESGCWIVENYAYRACPEPRREFPYAVSLHNHSCHSIETMGMLNDVVRLKWMRPFRHTLQDAFGFGSEAEFDFDEIDYLAPLTPEEVLIQETAAAAALGYGEVILGLTDHDEVAGSIELGRAHPEWADRIPLGEELAIHFEGYLFHLGVTGMSADAAASLHTELNAAANADRLDEVFEMLRASGCLVVFNHPLVPWGENRQNGIPARELLARYGWAIHALEYNGMRSRKENDAVLELARAVGKPVIGGGDSHLLLASSVLSVSHGGSFQEFAAEVKDGRGVTLITPQFFAPLGWKLFLRVLYFMAHYRRMARFRGQAVSELLGKRMVLLDPAGYVSRGFLRVAAALDLIR
jgi:hypothetical protein